MVKCCTNVAKQTLSKNFKEIKMKFKKFLFYLLAGLLAGCSAPFFSLHPLFTKDTLVFEEKLLGVWVADPNSKENSEDLKQLSWEFKRLAKSDAGLLFPNLIEEVYEKAYELVLSDSKGTKGSFVVCLVKLKDRFFLDLYPKKLPCQDQDPNQDPNLVTWGFNAFFFVPVHTFMVVDAIEPKLKMRWSMNGSIQNLLQDPNAPAHTLVEGTGTTLLTAPTKELQAFVLKYAEGDWVFPYKIVLTPRKIESPQGVNKP
jgi:hypothetical protein